MQSVENNVIARHANTCGRVIAIGDIHGCNLALQKLLEEIAPTHFDTLLQLQQCCRLVPLLGNHEQMLFCVRASQDLTDAWYKSGGKATVASFGPDGLHAISGKYLSFLESCRIYYETATHFFVHANYDPAKPLQEQDESTELATSLNEVLPAPHRSGKTAVVGHTAQVSGEILDLGYLKCIDTDCCHGGYLTALDVTTDQTWQAQECKTESACLSPFGIFGNSGACNEKRLVAN